MFRAHSGPCWKDFAAWLSECLDWRIRSIKLIHFEKLKPICPICSSAGRESILDVHSILKEKSGSVIEGILLCSNPQCIREYPVIDGIPIILSDLRTYISQNIVPVLCRNDLSAAMESLLGDCFGPGSKFDAYRQQISTYAFDHYGDLDPEKSSKTEALPGSIVRLLKKGIQSMDGSTRGGPIVDLGCAVGRTTFELAKEREDLVLGVDLNFGMLKTAASILEKGYASYPMRKVGISYTRREFPVVFEKMQNVDFWVCDATALPFCDNLFSMGSSLNVLDCVWSPYDHLKELARVLIPSGKAILSTPYDWAANATPIEAWLGGHSQRSEHKGAGEAILRSLLAGGGHAQAIEELELIHEEDIPWSLRLHNRSCMEYMVQMIVVRKRPMP